VTVSSRFATRGLGSKAPLIAIVFGTLLTGTALLDTDRMLEHGIERAHAYGSALPPADHDVAVLDAAPDDLLKPTMFGAPGSQTANSFSLGSRITVTAKDGHDIVFEVASISELGAGSLDRRTVAGPRLLLVIAKPVDPAASERPLRLVVDPDDIEASLAAPHGRAL
jgi:hypothetical protein